MPEKRPSVAQDSLLRAVSQTDAVGMLVFAPAEARQGRAFVVVNALLASSLAPLPVPATDRVVVSRPTLR